MPATSPTPRARWLAPLLLLLGSVFFTLIWIMLALYLERPCTWMAVLGAIDAALILRFAGMPAGWARAAWAMLATALMIALANWGIAATEIGRSMGLLPWESALRLGADYAWELIQLANTHADLAWYAVGVVLAGVLARR